MVWAILQEQASNKVKIEEDLDVRYLEVGQIGYTVHARKHCATFKDGRLLEDLIEDLDQGRVDPLVHPKLRLEVIERNGRFFSNDNRRLFCFKKHEEHVGYNVKVAARVYYWTQAFARYLSRWPERQRRVGDDPDYIRIRRKSWQNW